MFKLFSVFIDLALANSSLDRTALALTTSVTQEYGLDLSFANMLEIRFGCALVDNGQINLKNKKYEQDYQPLAENCDCSTCRHYTRAYLHSIATQYPVSCHLLTVHNIAYQMTRLQFTTAIVEELATNWLREKSGGPIFVGGGVNKVQVLEGRGREPGLSAKTAKKVFIPHVLGNTSANQQAYEPKNMRLMRGMRESIKAGKFPEFVQDFMDKMYSDGQYPKWVIDALSAVNIHLQTRPQEHTETSNKKPCTEISVS
ncbi:Queuine tRNA-ribosyltransferase catalytic subunit 1 [Homalodisca vitripennis]|nr:Queuine tRNA-ribosyltransferase catalytic subunit 1 [Homalodisca vitripennis]